jgi:hypothetical protein
LDEQPANYRISDPNIVNVAPLQFGEEVAKIHLVMWNGSVARNISFSFSKESLCSLISPLK